MKSTVLIFSLLLSLPAVGMDTQVVDLEQVNETLLEALYDYLDVSYYDNPEYRQKLAHWLGKKLLEKVQKAEACLDKVKELIVKGANVNTRNSAGNTPLLCSTFRGFDDSTLVLIEHGADIKAQTISGYTVLHNAVQRGNLAVCTLLLEKGADAYSTITNGTSPLLEAAKLRNKEICKLLLEHGAKVNVQNKRGWTPLLSACFYEDDNGIPDPKE